MFQDRQQAGRLLADKLIDYKKNEGAIIVAIPRGGVVIGAELAERLSLPMEAISVKKLGAPGNKELAIGAIASQGVKTIDWELALRLGVEQEYLDEEVEKKSVEVAKREKQLGIVNLDKKITDAKVVFLVDDGIATGATVLAAIEYINQMKHKPGNLPKGKEKNDKRKILAVPVVAKDVYDRLKLQIDQIVALEISTAFSAVGQFFREFPQVEDMEVVKLLNRYRK